MCGRGGLRSRRRILFTTAWREPDPPASAASGAARGSSPRVTTVSYAAPDRFDWKTPQQGPHRRSGLPRVPDRAGSGIGGGMGGELAVELSEQRDTIGETKLGTGGGERGILRRRGAVDDEAGARERLK